MMRTPTNIIISGISSLFDARNAISLPEKKAESRSMTANIVMLAANKVSVF